MITDIQYFAAHYVQFQENLNTDQKEEIIHWIKESSDDQIKSLLIKRYFRNWYLLLDQ